MGHQNGQEAHTRKSGLGIGKYLGTGSGGGSKGRTLEKPAPSIE